MDERTRSILLALAWLGEATKTHLGDLCCPGMSQRTLERALEPLMAEEAPLVQARPRHRHNGSVPKRESYAYSLTPAGHARLKPDPQYPRKLHRDQYPAKLADPRAAQLLEHDLQVAEIVVRLLVLARAQGLSGAFVAREVRLDRQRPDPVLDAVVVLHVGGAVIDGAPWTKDPPVAGERTWCFGIEGDRGTEPAATIAAKGRSYRDAWADPRTHADWQERYGHSLPLICWAAPTEKRLGAIDALWRQEWPRGSWLLAMPDALAKDGSARLTRAGDTTTVRLFADANPDQGMVRVEQPAPPKAQSAPQHPGTSAVVRPAAPPQAQRPSSIVVAAQPQRPAAPAGLPSPKAPSPAASASRVLPPRQSVPQSVKRSGWHLLWVVVVVGIAKLPWRIARALWRIVVALWSVLDDFSVGQADLWTTRALVVLVGATLLFTAPRWLPALVDAAQPAAQATTPPAATLRPLPPAPQVVATAAPVTCGQAQISANGVYLRPAPGTKNTPIGKLVGGTRLTLLCSESSLDDGSQWVLVRTEAGQEGWVAAQFVGRAP